MCMSILSPSLPGYFPAMLVAVRSKRFAPTSLQIAWINIRFPVPRGPASMADFIKGAFSCTPGDPDWRGRKMTHVNDKKQPSEQTEHRSSPSKPESDQALYCAETHLCSHSVTLRTTNSQWWALQLRTQGAPWLLRWKNFPSCKKVAFNFPPRPLEPWQSWGLGPGSSVCLGQPSQCSTYPAAEWQTPWRDVVRRSTTASVQCSLAAASCRGSWIPRQSPAASPSVCAGWSPPSPTPRTASPTFYKVRTWNSLWDEMFQWETKIPQRKIIRQPKIRCKNFFGCVFVSCQCAQKPFCLGRLLSSVKMRQTEKANKKIKMQETASTVKRSWTINERWHVRKKETRKMTKWSSYTKSLVWRHVQDDKNCEVNDNGKK